MFPELNTISLRRKKLGITQSALARSINMSQSMLTKIEREKAMPSYKAAVEIFDRLEELEHQEEKAAKDVMRRKVIALSSSDRVEKVAKIAKENGVSQFPVMDKKGIVGGIRTSALIGAPKNQPIGSSVGAPFPTVNETAPLSVVKNLLKYDQAVIVVGREGIVGIITAEDLI
ncbi:MAG: CBS domain-containing protein [Candidatus Micrarchaeota archaeon]|nr:CBS domain-containing protein [Candidatus Micrarchaeota archaeon]MDE1847782.1 CBS domain-containing protein [Candidatus Micrarchaeota archaeon]MDE1864220.1 CBS domain-containing protein [Candidatus Micrarchaeota archaeon]